jgi:lipopolysaccharide transport system ATP-binding protein
MQTWIALKRGKEDPHSKIGENKYKGDKDHFWALKDISFDIKQGDRVGIIGKNGAGKSTLLKILSRITAPTEGKLKIKGKIASLLEVGTGFHGELTGRENIYLNGAILGMKKKQVTKKLDQIVDFSGIEHHIDTPVKRYSSGMYVRLAFAVAAHLDSDILIADEVLAVGDAEFQKKALGKMQDLSTGEGRTVLFVSHNMAAVQQLCNKGLVLSNGIINYTGSCVDSVNNYINSSNKQAIFQEDGFIDLNIYREKDYEAKVFKRIRLLDENGVSVTSVPMSSNICIEVELENTEKYSNADYCIAILSSNGQWLTSYATWMFAIKQNNPRLLKLEIPSICFSPGSYKLYLSMTDHLAGKYIDRIEQSLSFEIESIDIFNTGREYTLSEGIVLPNGTLSLK